MLVNALDRDGARLCVDVEPTGRKKTVWYGGNLEERVEYKTKDGRTVLQLYGWRFVEDNQDNAHNAPDMLLKPCPFCGAPAAITSYLHRFSGQTIFYGKCINCGSSGGRATTSEEAISFWNLRQPITTEE